MAVIQLVDDEAMKPISLLPLLLFLFFATGCLRERDRSAEVEALIQKTVQERLENYEKIRMQRCREEILEEASRITDSLMILEARRKRDTTGRPPRPSRPEKPELPPLEDTIPLEPLLPEEDSIVSPDTTRQ
jgi:hypothetical protein